MSLSSDAHSISPLLITPSHPSISPDLTHIHRHAAVFDMSNDTQINQFALEIDKSHAQFNVIPFVDMRAAGIEVHARRDKLTNVVTAGRRKLITDFNSTALLFNSTKELLDNYRFRYMVRAKC
jgi:hypothetical protein